MEDKKNTRETNYRRLSLLLLGLLLLCLGAGFWMYERLWDRESNRLENEQEAMEGFLPGMSEAEIQKLLDDKVAEGSVQINMNTELVFANGRAKGYVRIVNAPNNHYRQVVEMIRKDSGETIYKTGAMQPGTYLEQDRLDVDLPKGDYPVTIHFQNYAIDSDTFIGEAVTENVIHILH